MPLVVLVVCTQHVDCRPAVVLTKSLSVSTFQPPISRWMWVSHYRSVSILDFVGAKDGEGR